MSRHIHMIDSLISRSRNRRLVYLRRISEVSETLESHDVSTDAVTSQSLDDVDGIHRLAPVAEVVSADAFARATPDTVAKRTRKISSVAQEFVPESHANGSSLHATTQAQSPSKPLPRSPKKEVQLPSDTIRGSQAIDRFIRTEKEFMPLYRKKVTWQESLARLRDVHTVFPAQILKEKPFIR